MKEDDTVECKFCEETEQIEMISGDSGFYCFSCNNVSVLTRK